MAGRRLVLLLPLLPLLAGPSHADYQSDRQWRDLPGGRAAMLIRRLYLGKQHSNTCLGNLKEQCLRWQGEPTERREVSAGEEHLLYYGKKTLYRGTGASNAAVGPEWREYTLREGKVVDEFEIVQTAVLTRADARHAIVIQYEGYEFCRRVKNSRLCTDTKRILTELGVRLANRFLPKR